MPPSPKTLEELWHSAPPGHLAHLALHFRASAGAVRRSSVFAQNKTQKHTERLPHSGEPVGIQPIAERYSEGIRGVFQGYSGPEKGIQEFSARGAHKNLWVFHTSATRRCHRVAFLYGSDVRTYACCCSCSCSAAAPAPAPAHRLLSSRRNSSQSDQTGNSFLLLDRTCRKHVQNVL